MWAAVGLDEAFARVNAAPWESVSQSARNRSLGVALLIPLQTLISQSVKESSSTSCVHRGSLLKC